MPNIRQVYLTISLGGPVRYTSTRWLVCARSV